MVKFDGSKRIALLSIFAAISISTGATIFGIWSLWSFAFSKFDSKRVPENTPVAKSVLHLRGTDFTFDVIPIENSISLGSMVQLDSGSRPKYLIWDDGSRFKLESGTWKPGVTASLKRISPKFKREQIVFHHSVDLNDDGQRNEKITIWNVFDDEIVHQTISVFVFLTRGPRHLKADLNLNPVSDNPLTLAYTFEKETGEKGQILFRFADYRFAESAEYRKLVEEYSP